MPGDAKLGMLFGVVLVILTGVMFHQRDDSAADVPTTSLVASSVSEERSESAVSMAAWLVPTE